MITNKPLPSLSDDGWIDNSMRLADYLLSHFFTSDYSQSYIYQDNISSLPWIIQHTQKNINDTIQLVQSTLSIYFNRYFDNVVVEVSEVSNNEDISHASISIYLSFVDKSGVSYDISKLIDITDSKINKIISLNNGAK